MRKNYRNNLRKKKNKNNNILLLFIIIILLAIIFLMIMDGNSFKLFNSSKENNSNNNDNNDVIQVSSDDVQKNTTPIEDTHITMSVVGDIMCHDSQYKDAYNSTTKEYDFSYVFSNVKYYLQTADISVGNLETTFAGKEVGYSNYPTFNTPEALAYDLKKIGIDVLSTANNHSLDKRYSGLESTIKFLDDADIAHTGTYTSEEEQNKILIQNVKGIKIAFLSFTYGTNGIPIPSGKDYCINLIDENLILKQIELAKSENPDLICAFMHWGTEYVTNQLPSQEKYADLLFKNGVDIILGGHPHVLEPMEKRTITLDDGTTKDGFVIYSLGNFISGQTKENTKTSAILNLKITKNGYTGKMSIDEANYVPIYMYRSTSGQTQRYKLLVTETAINNYESGQDTSIGSTTYKNLKNALNLTKQILGEEIK